MPCDCQQDEKREFSRRLHEDTAKSRSSANLDSFRTRMPRCSARIFTADGRAASPLPDEAITGLLSTKTKNGMQDDRYDRNQQFLMKSTWWVAAPIRYNPIAYMESDWPESNDNRQLDNHCDNETSVPIVNSFRAVASDARDEDFCLTLISIWRNFGDNLYRVP